MSYAKPAVGEEATGFCLGIEHWQPLKQETACADESNHRSARLHHAFRDVVWALPSRKDCRRSANKKPRSTLGDERYQVRVDDAISLMSSDRQAAMAAKLPLVRVHWEH
ncbi:hypothetical protein EN836_07340 [Mesorhizobium sp. M1C.F.Ca.ET.193.01.1.1]|uniref:hypothetical protein n=1 Tax=unclassified Mesorhizobium TaxID=325217 RepID=UPI000FD4711D|nr:MULTISPECIES: hypothetical protein [unclassified Mesorhizobium]TGT02519.1 hypothetical protein EN820_25760 [bacterium M00.F.Ca.ET.177.01.1.1]TGQ55205.1 hypothetical protein EN853_08235 [Mesorhizobium sp. M1C.F.Ca.ET.210.01.1.1]TGQ73849.1 hypothetical protein EN855_008245 [Mesorhizobium sp. M1C.F.Ca.ET.212.01.1.1]TGR12338.1 hypothetical protein EN847_07340 [Mesorhizobium sp. M1C.F.Ca.ET.204.01.1.1]TGR31866.1 hypothetical protein EN839_08240 [Mesorhizobium sp. M1C.F.Ca.ET.196.01.1.1]